MIVSLKWKLMGIDGLNAMGALQKRRACVERRTQNKLEKFYETGENETQKK